MAVARPKSGQNFVIVSGYLSCFFLARDPIGFREGQNKSKPDRKSRLLTRLLPSINTC